MKHIYKYIILMAFAFSSLALTAQSDTTLTKQVILEREYAPTLKDANRINETPKIYEYVVKPYNAKFIDQAPVLSFQHNKLGVVGSGDIGNQINYTRKRAYFGMGAGTNGNIESIAGVRILDTQKDRLNFFATYDATSGNVDFIDKTNWHLQKTKAKRADLKANLTYSHVFKPLTLDLYASYLNAGYNYYGNSFIPPVADDYIFPYDVESKQKLDVITGGAGIHSNINPESKFNYSGNLEYSHFKNKYGLLLTEDGIKGGIIKANADFNAEVSSDGFFGGRLYFMNQSFSNDKLLTDSVLHSYSNITANPYFKFKGLNWDLEFGVKASAVLDYSNKFFVAPNIKARLSLGEVNALYANITGGINDNTVLDIFAENRYTMPLNRVKYSKTQYDIQLGFQSGAVSGMEFDIFGGYKNTKDDHLYIASSAIAKNINGASSGVTDWTNFSIPAYAEVNTGHGGAMIRLDLIPKTVVSAKVIGYFYSVKKPSLFGIELIDADKKAWGKPSFTVDLDAQIKPIDALTLALNYYMAGGRKAYQYGETIKMKDISELNALVEFQFIDWFSIYGRVNNIFNQKHDIVHGYTMQGMNVMGGMKFNF